MQNTPSAGRKRSLRGLLAARCDAPPSRGADTCDEICSQFLDALTYDRYPFQEKAVLAWFECDGGVLVAAPTGMGKTLIAEIPCKQIGDC